MPFSDDIITAPLREQILGVGSHAFREDIISAPLR